MKRILTVALAVTMGACVCTAFAADKKKQKDAPAQPEPLTLDNRSDSLSYAAGKKLTEGLIPYLMQQLSVDTTYMDVFVGSFEAAMAEEIDERMKAEAAGKQIAIMVTSRMLPNLRNDFEAPEDSIRTDMFVKGFTGALMKDNSLMADTTAIRFYADAVKQETDRKNQATIKAGEEFLAGNKDKEGVITTESGLQYKVLEAGDGDIAEENDEVEVKYEGRLLDGTVFDSSEKRPNGSARFRPNKVIKGWTEALTMMPTGSKWELYIPQELAYGERKSGKIPPFSTLIFTVEVVSVKKAQEAAPAPEKSAVAIPAEGEKDGAK